MIVFGKRIPLRTRKGAGVPYHRRDGGGTRGRRKVEEFC